MMRIWRLVFAAVAVVFVAGVVVQVFLAGLMIFAGESPAGHIGLGWMLHLVPLAILLLAWAARSGRTTLLIAAALAVTTFIQPILATMRGTSPTAAALHPVVAMLVFALAAWVAVRAVSLARVEPRAAASAEPMSPEASAG